MRAIDPGHLYLLDNLDDPAPHAGTLLTFVKRVGARYPGNIGPAHGGTTTQEVIRALIDRLQYVDAQISSPCNHAVIEHLRECIRLLEYRAADERSDLRVWSLLHDDFFVEIEREPTCRTCGHICSIHGEDGHDSAQDV